MILYADDLIKELKEKNFCPTQEITCMGLQIEGIKLEPNRLNIITDSPPISELEEKINDLESDLEDVESRADEAEDVLYDIKFAFDDDELKNKINEYFCMHPDNKLTIGKLSLEDLIDFVKTVTDWYKI